MSVGGDTRPFREKYPGYATVFPGTLASHYKQALGTVKKNTTVATYNTVNCRGCYTDGGWNSVTKDVDPNTGKSTLDEVPYWTRCTDGEMCCVQGGIGNPIALTDNANTFAVCDALLAVTVTNGGTGYTDGDVLTITGAYPETINGTPQVATFRVKVTAGVIQSATVLTAGCYSGIGANALTAQTTATGGTGTGATFGFTRKDAQYDFGRCNIVGWTAAAAARQWHGTYDFLDSCYTCPTDNTQGNPPQTKYLKITLKDCYNASVYLQGANFPGGIVIPFDYSLAETASELFGQPDVYSDGYNKVEANSGVIEYALNNSSFFYPGVVGQQSKNGILVDGSGNPILDVSGNVQASDCGDGGFTEAAFCTTPLDGSEYWTFTYSTKTVNDDPDDTSEITITGTGEPPSYDANWWCANYVFLCTSGVYDPEKQYWTSDLHYFKNLRTITNTEVVFGIRDFEFVLLPEAGNDVDIKYGTAILKNFSGTITLSEPNTPTDVELDSNENLLSPWVLVDPVLMPLTTQPFDGTVVKVSRNEVGSNVSPVGYSPYYVVDTSTTPNGYKRNIDPNLAILTAGGLTAGQILGLPLDKTIGGDYPLDYFFADYVLSVCEDCNGDGNSSWDTIGYGDLRSNHASLPPRATQWTNSREGLFITTGRKQFIGGWIGTEGGGNICTSVANDGKIWSTKWIETSVRLPSVNHARPFGLDRYTLDATNRACVDSFDGTTLTTRGSEPTFTAGDLLACVGTDADGLYTFDSMSGTDYLLTFVSALPDNFPPLPTGDVNGIVAKINWSHVPPMAGRLHIISITDNGDGTVTVTSDPMPVLNKADTLNPLYNVDLSDKTMTPLAKNLAPAAEIPDSNGNLPGSTSSTPGQKPLGAPVDYIPTPLTTSEFICTADYATVKDAVWLTLYGAIPTADTSPAPPAEVAPWYWNDDKGKGNYWIGQWFYENQVYSDAVAVEYQKGFVYCSPYAIVLSSNATDTPTGVNYSGVRYDFSTPFIADEFCASARWMDVCQMMQDPYWTPPICCAPEGFHPCPPENAIPFVEARLIMPGNHQQPDNGAGMSQTEAAPSGGNHINYTVDLSATTGLGGNPPSGSNIFNQPACVLAPAGVYVPNLDSYCTFCENPTS